MYECITGRKGFFLVKWLNFISIQINRGKPSPTKYTLPFSGNKPGVVVYRECEISLNKFSVQKAIFLFLLFIEKLTGCTQTISEAFM